MLTPVEIQSKTFKSGGLGYDKKDVDAFMRDLLKSYEELYRDNMELKDKVSVLNEGIQYYKSIEKTLQKALMLAEKTAEETRSNAEREAKRIEKEAVVKANIMVADARNELDNLHKQTVNLVQQYERYKIQFKNLAASQIDIINSPAFQINIQTLDAFSADAFTNLDGSASDRKEKIMPEEIGEIVADEAVIGSKHLSSIIEEEKDEYDFEDFEGQEEFDFGSDDGTSAS